MIARITYRKTAIFFKVAAMLLIAGIVCHSSGKLFAQTSRYKFQETINLVNLVNDAASEIGQRGERAFKEFMP